MPDLFFLLAPFLTWFWGWQNRRAKEPGSVIKMSIRCTLLGLSFLVLMFVVKGLQPDQKNQLLVAGAFYVYLYDRRTLPFTDRTFLRHKGRSRSPGRIADGDLVPGDIFW